ncbi:hypothetical protein ACIQUY_11555 [Streptomyces sp. NPDC090231]|uniref:hypothetical protein n=1 Tax=unclassified Streptomyces TaxID=2593676 RepID=UPI00381A35B0
MTRWGGPFARRRGDRSPAPVERAATNRPEAAPERLLLEDYDGLLLLRTPSDDTLTATDVADLARSMRTDDGTVTVIAGAEGAQSAAFWPRLSELLDSLRDSGTESVQLVMAGAGRDIKDRPATARRIADGWGFEVRAPDGPPLVVPGGSLFVPVTSRANGRAAAGGWWRFAPGAEPEPLGPRSPEPSWQSALRGVPSGTAGGSVVEQIPAGLLVRPAEAAPAQPGDLYHAVPVDARRPAVVIGVPYGEDVSAEEVAEVLTALPEGVRSGVRLAPGGRRDVLSLAQSVSDRLDADVEVMTGLPLVAAGGPLGTYSIRSVLAAPDGTPTWMPFVDAVVCRPPDENGRARLPRVLRWTPPLPGPARPEEGVVGLTDRWQVTVTRAGLWVGLRGGPPLSPTARQVDPGGPVIELGMPGELMDGSLWPALSGLLAALTPALRERATLHVHGVSQDGGLALRRLAAQHGLRTLRYAAPAPARAGLKPRGQARPGPATTTAPTATAAAPSAPVRTPLPTTGRSGGPVPASVPASTPASAPAPAQGVRPGPGPGQGPQTQSSQPELPVQPSQAGPGRPGRAAGSGSVPPAEGTGRVARAERARQLREAMATGTAASAGAGADAGASGRSVGPGSAARPADPGAVGEPGASGEPAAKQETGGEAEEFDWSDEGVPTGSLGRARRAQAAGVRASGPAAGPPTPGEDAEDGDESGSAGTDVPARPADPGRADAPQRTAEPSGSVEPGNAAEPAEPAEPSEGSEGSEPAEPSGPGDSADPGSGAIDGAVPADEPELNGAPSHAPVPGPGADTKKDDPSAPDAPDAPDAPSTPPAPSGSGEPRDDGREALDRGADQADTGEAPGRPDGVPPAEPVRAESGPPAEPAPATPPTSQGATASREEAVRVPDTSMAPGAPEAVNTTDAPDVPDIPDTPLPPVPLEPGHRSSEAERTAFRALADRGWDRHGAAVSRSLARVPALRGKEQEAARADLIALRMYLLTPEGPLSHGAVIRALREYEPDMLPYGACVASALNRLPSYRGAVVRGTGSDPASDGSGVPALPRPGTLLRDAALLSTTPLDSDRAAMAPGGSYVIWSVAGRRVRQLSDHSRGPEEVVFAPGTLFRVLDVRRDGPSVQIFLRELTGPATATAPDPDADRAVLARLDDVVRGRSTTPAGTGHWPERCAGAVGAGP